MTSSAHDADLKGNNFRRSIHPQSFIAVAFIFSELDGGGLPEPPPVQKIEKKPGLDRVNIRVFSITRTTFILSTLVKLTQQLIIFFYVIYIIFHHYRYVPMA